MFAMTTKTAGAARPAQGFKWVALGVLLAVSATVALSAWAQPAPGTTPAGGPPPHGAQHGPQGPHHGPRGFDGPAGLFFGPAEHVERSLDHLLRGLNATDAQRSQIRQIALAASADLKPTRDAARDLHKQQAALFAATVVDARAVEANRVQHMALHDQVSKRVTQALLDVSAVLSPEQRAQLAARAKEHEAQREKGRQDLQKRLQNRTLERRGAASAPAQ